MSLLLNVGYQFAAPDGVVTNSSMLLASAMPAHQLLRRHMDARYPHLETRLFDPQLYLAGLDAAASSKHCAYLGSYSWFGVKGLVPYDSAAHTQKAWSEYAQSEIKTRWPRNAPSGQKAIEKAAQECVEFQKSIGCAAIILPSPLTVDPGTDYSGELAWVDAGLAVVAGERAARPVYATVAMTDICVRYSDPLRNSLLALILDTVSARGVDGVYLVVEQGSEPNDTRQCGSTRVLWSLLHLVHVLAHDSRLKVGVNFIGPFALACEAAGAEWWATGWYKSLYRVRIADKLAGGRSYPLYWSHAAATDIHLETDFDELRRGGLLSAISDRTTASAGLLDAAGKGVSVARVPQWRYAQSIVTAATAHYLLSALDAERRLTAARPATRPDKITEWLDNAFRVSERIARVLGRGGRTRLDHVQAWRDAFTSYRNDHKV